MTNDTLWTLAHHVGLDRTVIQPYDAMPDLAGWEPVGEPTTDRDALVHQLETKAEQARIEAILTARKAAAMPPDEPAARPPVREPLPKTTSRRDATGGTTPTSEKE